MKLSYKRQRRQPSCNCSENVKNPLHVHKSSQTRPRTSARVHTPYHEKLRHATKNQFGLGNFMPPAFISPVEGDLIEFDRKLYSHWAVFIGDGQVIHVSGESADIASKNVQVRQSGLSEVAHDSLVRINNKAVPAKDRNLKALEPKKIVAQARKCLGTPVHYDMLTSNAEHYATLWRYGKAWSDQADMAKAVMNPHKRRAASSTSSNSSINSITSAESDEITYKRSVSDPFSKRKSSASSGSPTSPVSPPPLHSPLSDKDASFQNSLLAGLTAIFSNGKSTARRSVTLRSQTTEARIEQ